MGKADFSFDTALKNSTTAFNGLMVLRILQWFLAQAIMEDFTFHGFHQHIYKIMLLQKMVENIQAMSIWVRLVVTVTTYLEQ